MAEVTIGKNTYDVPELNFVALELSWAYIDDVIMAPNPVRAVGAGLFVIAAGLMNKNGFKPENYGINTRKLDKKLDLEQQIHWLVTKKLKTDLLASQISNVTMVIMEIVEEAGMLPKQGEGEKGEDKSPNPSMETSSRTSPNSSPRASKAARGKKSGKTGRSSNTT